jgi:hypothetical protein
VSATEEDLTLRDRIAEARARASEQKSLAARGAAEAVDQILGSASPELAPLLTSGSMMLRVLAVVSESVRPSRARDAA